MDSWSRVLRLSLSSWSKSVVAALSSLVSACVQLEDPATSTRPVGIYVVQDGEGIVLERRAEAAAASRWIMYMNRNGGTFTPGNNDSRTNRSSIISFTSTISPWTVSESGWQEVMTCVRSLYAPFDIQVTDVDPGSKPHLESVVAGFPEDIGMDSNVAGVSPFLTDCGVIDNSIVFTFADLLGNNFREVCETVAQEVAHSFGLDHEYLCADPMTYLTGCGNKKFQNKAAQCSDAFGDPSPTCLCGQTSQNSVSMLTARIGAKTGGGGDTVSPTTEITFPRADARVQPGFEVTASAHDDVAVDRVELMVDGTFTDTDETRPYSFTTSPNLSAGLHDIAVRAVDTSGNDEFEGMTVEIDPAAEPSHPPPDDTDGEPPGGEPGGGGGPATTGGGSHYVGGCDTSRGGAGPMAALLLAALFTISPGKRRRRRREWITSAVGGLYLVKPRRITMKRPRQNPERVRRIELREPRAVTDARLATATGGACGKHYPEVVIE